jgi:hypothetical protein
MGGYGSGGWYRLNKKSTVEESLVLGIKSIRRWLRAGMAGSLTWTWSGGGKSNIGYFVTDSSDGLTVTLHYRWRDTENVVIPVRLEATPTQFAGWRWWFTCPLIVRGIPCRRRAGKLYLPPGTKYFGCRKCYDLTYRSCQEAHQTERLFGRLGFDAELARLWEQRYK